MKILLTNDDGINAKAYGLVNILKEANKIMKNH